MHDLDEARTEHLISTRRELNRRRTAEDAELQEIRRALQSREVDIDDVLTRLSALESRRAVTLTSYDALLAAWDALDVEQSATLSLLHHHGLRAAGAA